MVNGMVTLCGIRCIPTDRSPVSADTEADVAEVLRHLGSRAANKEKDRRRLDWVLRLAC